MNRKKIMRIVATVMACASIGAISAFGVSGCIKKNDDPAPTIENVAVDGVSLNKSELSIEEGKSGILKATVTPDGATNKHVTWTSSNSEVATVDSGLVTAVKAGKATITVTTADGEKTATCEVTVTAASQQPVNDYTVTFDANGHGTAPQAQTVAKGGKATKPQDLTASGYAFGGWYTTKECTGTEFDFNTAINATTTLYAKWTPNTPVKDGVTGVTVKVVGGGEPTVVAGGNLDLTADVAGNGNFSAAVTWKIKEEGTGADVTQGGYFTAGNVAGKVTVVATSMENTAIYDELEITVTAAVTAVTDVTLDKATVNLQIGGTTTATITATVAPTNATNKNVTWKSSNEEVATVADGVVTAVAAGKATITVTTEDGNKTATCEVTVAEQGAPTPQTVAVEGVTLDNTKATLKLGETTSLTLKPTVAPDNATNKNVTWKSSDEKVATVNSGVVTAVAKGTATITVTTEDGSKTATCEVTVEEADTTVDPTPGDYTTGVHTLDLAGPDKDIFTTTLSTAIDSGYQKTHFKIGKGDTLHVNLKLQKGKIIKITGKAKTFDPAKGDSSFKITQGTGTKGAVDSYGEQTRLSGTAEIDLNYTLNVTTEGEIVLDIGRGSVASTGCNITELVIEIKDPEPVYVQSVSVKEATALKVGGTEKLTATVTPANADDRVTWDSDNKEVATVDQEGNVTAHKAGTANITVTSVEDGDIKATCVVTVTNVMPTSISLGSQTETNTAVGKVITLTATVLPENTTVKTVTWSSSDDTIATVDSNGKVTGVKEGSVVITATSTEDTNVKATITVHVLTELVEVTGVSFEHTTASINMEEAVTLKLTANVAPANATNKAVVWSSSDKNIATVDENGLVTARRGGEVTITATTVEGSFEATCTITVTAPKPVAGMPNISKASVDELETAYVEWTAENCKADWFNVYYAADNEDNWKKLDGPLVRQYADYYRADMVGLKAGTYKMKVVPVVGNEEVTEVAATANGITVKAHVREGYAFTDNKAPGAYNLDGTPKQNAQIIYVTAETAKTVAAKVSGQTVTGLQNIFASRKGDDTDPLIIRIVGTITDSDMDSLGSSEQGMQIKGGSATKTIRNITIEGIGNDATIWGFGILLRNSSEIEIRNLGFLYFKDDGISIDTDNKHLWVHNNDFFYGKGGSGDKVKGDGSLDTKGSTHMTYSYNHFWDSGKCNLQGMKSEDSSYRITYHHNWYDHSDSRHPRIRTATVHIYNNYFDGNAKYGVGVTTGASAFVENNYFRTTHGMKPMMSSGQGTDAAGDGTFSGETGGIIKSYGNKYDGPKTLVTYQQNGVDFDCYEASSRNEQVPSSVKTKEGGTGYNNFDTASDFYTYKVETPDEAKTNCERYGGRVDGGDLKWDFDDAVEDANYAIITELKEKVTNYKSSVVKIGN